MKRSLLAFALLSVATIAQAAPPSEGGAPSIISNILLVVGFLLIFYFMLIRPQQKRSKEHQNLVSNVAKDDEVIVGGGLLGKVTKVTDQFVMVAIAEGVEVTVQKQAISATFPKGTMSDVDKEKGK
ncbi:MAG: preprotein translocase subunit YajC [Candidatus Berkiellales bacterium]